MISSKRWALVTELKGADEPDFADVIAKLSPCDLIIVEGYKTAAIPKIEARRSASISKEPLAARDAHVIAIAADHAVTDARGLPVFALDDIAAMADLITARILR